MASWAMGGFVWFWDSEMESHGIPWENDLEMLDFMDFHGFSMSISIFHYPPFCLVGFFFSASACCIGEASHQLAGRSKTFGNLRSRLPISEKLSFSLNHHICCFYCGFETSCHDFPWEFDQAMSSMETLTSDPISRALGCAKTH